MGCGSRPTTPSSPYASSATAPETPWPSAEWSTARKFAPSPITPTSLPGPTAGSETTDALEFLARLTSHIPNKGQVLQRYYGFYSSRQRGKRRKANGDAVEEPLVMVDPKPEAIRKAKRRWAELLRRIFEVDPLVCPRCGDEMRIVALITEAKTIDRILDHLRRTQTSHRRQRAPPRRWKSAASTAST